MVFSGLDGFEQDQAPAAEIETARRRRLTEQGLIAKRSGLVSLLDIERLEKIADAPEAFLEDFAVL